MWLAGVRQALGAERLHQAPPGTLAWALTEAVGADTGETSPPPRSNSIFYSQETSRRPRKP